MSHAGPGTRQVVRVDNGFGYGVIGADLHVFPDRGPVYLLSEHRPASVLTDQDTAWFAAQPSRLLNARFQIVDFTGRDQERAELAAWRDGGGPRAAATWLHGPGGQGKTRLAAQFAAESAAAGWKVVMATHGSGVIQPHLGSQDLRLDGAAGLLLVIDYADRWPLSHLTWLFSNKLLDRPLPTRLLLLARSVAPWPAVRAALEDAAVGAGDHALRPLANRTGELGERQAMFTVARNCFAARYGLVDPSVIDPPDYLDRPDFGLILALHMAALVAVDAHIRGSSAPSDMAGLSAYLLGRERRHWTQLYENRLEGLDYETPPSAMSQVVFTATLTGAVAHPEGMALLSRLGLERPGRLLVDHTTCYPPQEPGAVLEPLYPDRLAEDFLALSLPGHEATGYPTAPWAVDTTGRLVARDAQGSPPAHLARALTFLASAAAPHRWPHAIRHLESLLRADPALAVAAGGAALTALASLDLDAAVLEAVDAHIPRHGQVDLDAGVAAFTQRLTGHRLAATDDPAEHARLYQDLGFRMLRAGHREEAVAATEKAVGIFRRLAAAAPATYEPALAAALADLSECAFQTDRKEASRRAAEEAVGIFEGLAAADPTAYEPGLALSLSHLGQGMSEARKPEEALAATQRAMGIFQRLAATAPALYEPGLAMALTNAAVYSWKLRRWPEAVTAAERAVEIIRRLVAAAGPAMDGPDLTRSIAMDEAGLATALSNLATFRWGARHRDGALSALREAVEIGQRLVAVNPAAHEPLLAEILASLGTCLAQSGQGKEALAVTGEVVEIYRRLAAGRPSEFEEPLREACEAHQVVRDRLSGVPEEDGRTWTLEEHYVTLLNQDEVWQDAQDRRHRLDDMDSRYCGNVLRFLLRQADVLFEKLADGLGASPESLGRWEGEDAQTWLARQPLTVALRRRSEGKPARSGLCYCGYGIQPGWQHDHCYRGIIVD
ncbi:tetratricopeptide repeat protein [Streptomyces malaysiensis]|uniref:Tetratricopeptide repeat protein n=1 Tax=Streptomyces malaysiensis subsp. samsunensis TaxID=459658 RepID=A0A9X2M7H0_STRMQ|nr:tetratricopeptide repeat protein [Streptomyces samsunensis]MCQ8836200.1 tetratricopeptide repeat protein [Streptomyces samsunensis]